jgi:hypothetical protein
MGKTFISTKIKLSVMEASIIPTLGDADGNIPHVPNKDKELGQF